MAVRVLAAHKRKKIQAYQHLINEAQIEGIGQGDKNALERLYRSTVRAVYAYILSIIRNPADTPKLVEETYVWVRKSAHLYTPTGKPLAWIFSIAFKLAQDYCQPYAGQPEKGSKMDIEPSLDRISTKIDRVIFRCALRVLSTEERQVLFLYSMAGLRYWEISTSLSLHILTVYIRYKSSIYKLTRHLEKRG